MPSLEERVLTPKEIPYLPKNGDIFVAAFTSVPFRERASYGLTHAKTMHAESGFSVITNGEQLIYSAVALGGMHPDSQIEYALGHQAATLNGLETLDVIVDEKILNDWPQNPRYTLLGTFHFHSPHSQWLGFSPDDFESYENVQRQVYNINVRPDYMDGVFVSRLRNGETKSKLLLIQGPLSSQEYLEMYERKAFSLDAQRTLLDRCGFRTILADLPMRGNVVDLGQLKTALVQKSYT